YMQDVPGTAAGNWGVPLAGLALVHDRVDPGVGVISISLGLNSGSWRFAIAGSGTVNRDFRQVTGDGTTYCYDASAGGDLPGIVLIQLTVDGPLLFEQQSVAGCGSGPWVFTENGQSFLR